MNDYCQSKWCGLYIYQLLPCSDSLFSEYFQAENLDCRTLQALKHVQRARWRSQWQERVFDFIGFYYWKQWFRTLV